MKTILSWVGLVAVVFGIGFIGGANTRDAYYRTQLAKAKAAFEQRLAEAADAYAKQKDKDDAELAALQKLVSETPPDARIAIKKDAAKRIGAVR